jgi:transcriptional/translational regulatory protein YebC/TACO1
VTLLSLWMPDELKVLTSVTSEAEAELVIDRLLEADIHAISQRTIGGPEWGSSGARSVYVKEGDLDRARAVLEADEGEFSDEELTRLSEEAGRDANER